EGRNRHYRLGDRVDPSGWELWHLVRDGLRDGPVYQADGERARVVLQARRERSTSFFARSAEEWEELRDRLFGPRAWLTPLFALTEPHWVVGDLGAGTGALAASMAPYVARVIGVDRSDEMLATAAGRLAGFENVELRRGDLESLPVEAGTLDLAVMSLVLHYVVDPPDALSEAFRVLAPGGRLVVTDMRSHERGPAYAEEMGHVWPGFALERVSEWMTDAGFTAVSVRPIPPDPAGEGPPLFTATGRKP
ncbi:MAG: methyltransferase domain-containing protein, partial [Gemmatimonadota bacterium]|nr:methyltransferase domain-containing protein [Gemmatimonadota bacterium]